MNKSSSPEPAPPEPKTKRVQTQRTRWATRKMTVKSGRSKRMSLLNRMGSHRRKASGEKTNGGNNEPPLPDDDPAGEDVDNQEDEEEEADDDANSRTLFFNLPLPDEFMDEEGHPVNTYPRNKIRTAKYTPLSFVPKNLWFQFHNVANIFFLIVVILVVSSLHLALAAIFLCPQSFSIQSNSR